MSLRHRLTLALVVGTLAGRPASVAAAPGVAVVELFSSEGCSSCPPADRVLADLAAAARSSGSAVYTLEFHVDYWDHLGWADPWDSPAFTVRQARYREKLGLASLYTPQMIVNGRAEFVGSREDRAKGEIARALAHPATADVCVRARGAGRVWDADWQVQGAPADARLCVALVESELVSRVARGENAGRTLAHASVVRAFESFPLNGRAAGHVRLVPPAGVRAEHARVIAFVQSPRDLAVLGAGASP